MKTLIQQKTFISSALTLALATLLSANIAHSATKEEIAQAKTVAFSVCEAAAKEQYGEDGYNFTSNKVRWSGGLGGTKIHMKAKRAGRPMPMTCIAELDGDVRFAKGYL